MDSPLRDDIDNYHLSREKVSAGTRRGARDTCLYRYYWTRLTSLRMTLWMTSVYVDLCTVCVLTTPTTGGGGGGATTGG